jgi:multiple sugar transport system permease protein
MTAPTAAPARRSGPANDVSSPLATRRQRSPSGQGRGRVGRATQPLLSGAATNLILVVAVAYTVLPLVWLLMASTKDLRDLFSTNGFAPGARFSLWQNLEYLFTADNGIYVRWLVNSLLYAGIGAILAALLSVMAGYAFDKFAFPAKEKFFGFVLLGVMIPSTAIALPTYLLASKVGLVNTFWGVFLPGLVFPFGVYLARIFSTAYVPDEVIEAARMDGAGEARIFRSIALPMMSPGFVTIVLFQFTAIWNSFFMPLVMLSDAKLYPVNLGLYVWNSTALSQGHPDDYLLAITGSMVAVLPLAVLFLALQRFWRSGLTSGAVK